MALLIASLERERPEDIARLHAGLTEFPTIQALVEGFLSLSSPEDLWTGRVSAERGFATEHWGEVTGSRDNRVALRLRLMPVSVIQPTRSEGSFEVIQDNIVLRIATLRAIPRPLSDVLTATRASIEQLVYLGQLKATGTFQTEGENTSLLEAHQRGVRITYSPDSGTPSDWAKRQLAVFLEK